MRFRDCISIETLRGRGRLRIAASLSYRLSLARRARACRRATIAAMQEIGRRIGVRARLVLALGGAGAAAGALAIAEGLGRFTTYAGSSAAGTALTLTAGLALIAAGVALLLGDARDRIATLAVAAGAVWFAPVWVAWQEGPPLVRSFAAVAAPFLFALVAHLVLAAPSGAALRGPARVLAAVIYVEAAVAAGALALFRAPYLDPGC